MNKSAAVSSFVKSLRFADTLIDSSANLSELQQTDLNGTQHDETPDIPDVNERLGNHFSNYHFTQSLPVIAHYYMKCSVTSPCFINRFKRQRVCMCLLGILVNGFGHPDEHFCVESRFSVTGKRKFQSLFFCVHVVAP